MRTGTAVSSDRDQYESPESSISGAGTEPHGQPGRRLYRIPDAMRLLSLSRSVVYEQIRAGRLRSVRQGRTRLVPADAIADYVALLVREAGADDGRPA